MYKKIVGILIVGLLIETIISPSLIGTIETDNSIVIDFENCTLGEQDIIEDGAHVYRISGNSYIDNQFTKSGVRSWRADIQGPAITNIELPQTAAGFGIWFYMDRIGGDWYADFYNTDDVRVACVDIHSLMSGSSWTTYIDYNAIGHQWTTDKWTEDRWECIYVETINSTTASYNLNAGGVWYEETGPTNSITSNYQISYIQIKGDDVSVWEIWVDDLYDFQYINQPPVADANGPYYGDEDEVINLDGSGSYDSNGHIIAYEWDLDNDGQYDDATGSTPSWSWSTGGSHPIFLKVTDNEDATDTDGTMVYINEYPVADANGPYYGDKDETIDLDGSESFDNDGFIISLAWDIDNDGQYDDATGAKPSWLWSESGIYTIGLKVTDDDDATAIDTSKVYIGLEEYPPIASFTYDPEQPMLGDTVSFDASGSNDPDGNIVSYNWDFGDDTTGSGKITSHMYNNPAKYTVVLTVVDNDDNFDTFSVVIEVGIEGDSPVAYFTINPVNPCVNDSIVFNASSSFSPSDIIESYMWCFGDDNTGTGMIIDHVFTCCGDFSVNLTVCDSHGLNGSVIKIVHVDPLDLSCVLIGGISGGLGVNVSVDNVGSGDAFDVGWSIIVEKKIGLILSGSYTENVIDVLAAGGTGTIQSSGLRGIGWITITVQVSEVVKQATAFLLGSLVLRVMEV